MCLKSCLQFPAEATEINQVNPTVHIAEAIGRAHNCTSRFFENVALRDSHVGDALEVFLPTPAHIGIYVAQFKDDRFHVSSTKLKALRGFWSQLSQGVTRHLGGSSRRRSIRPTSL